MCSSPEAVAQGVQGKEEGEEEEEEDRFDWLVVPVVLFTPETSFIFSVGGLFTLRLAEVDDGRPTVILPSLTYTLRNQTIAMLDINTYFAEGRRAHQGQSGVSVDQDGLLWDWQQCRT